MKPEIPPPVKHLSVSSVTATQSPLYAHIRLGRWIDWAVEIILTGVHHTPSFIKRIPFFKLNRRKRNWNETESARFLK